MPVLLLLLGLFLPRVTAVVLWLFAPWFSSAFTSWVIPVLGFIFLPYTMLWFSAVQNWYGGVWGPWQTLLIVIALILDFTSYTSFRR